MKLLAVARRLLVSHLGQPKTFLIMLALPLIFTLIFGGLLAAEKKTTSYPIALSLPAQDFTSEAIAHYLEKNSRLNITTCSEEEARKLVHDRKVVAAIIIPTSLIDSLEKGNKATFALIREEENNIYLAARQEVNQALYEINAAAYVARQTGSSPSDPQWKLTFNDTLASFNKTNLTLTVTPLSRTISEIPARNRANTGFTIMFLMMGLITATGTMLQERTDGTWQRLLATPIKRSQILGGYLLGYFVLGWIQFGILAIVSHLIFGIEWGNPLGLVVLISLFILCSISLALALGGLVRTFQQQQAVSTILITASSMLAGIFWPLELEPQFMQTIARGIPQYWAVRGLNDLLSRGLDWPSLSLPLIVLGSFSIIFFIFGSFRLKMTS